MTVASMENVILMTRYCGHNVEEIGPDQIQTSVVHAFDTLEFNH